ncbi:hypothetical protein HIM_01467 [Hirsutella minnesotensis 3608]|nr:hypothetical protein HIM_01467 [Hirsutella minnesotensis 3608]
MNLISLHILLFFSLRVIGLVTPVIDKSIDSPTWEVQIHPGGPRIVLNGTVEQAHAKMLELNPNWDSDFLSSNGANATVLEKRTDFSESKVNCDAPWGHASVDTISTGIGYLWRIGDVGYRRPWLASGPGTCARSYSKKTLASFRSIAVGASHIISKCTKYGQLFVAGQVFHRTGWNVVVRADKC